MTHESGGNCAAFYGIVKFWCKTLQLGMESTVALHISHVFANCLSQSLREKIDEIDCLFGKHSEYQSTALVSAWPFHSV